MTQVSLFSFEDLSRYVTAAGENSQFEAKSPMEWSGQVESAKLAKSIAAFANSEGGGAIVIGKSQQEDNTFELNSLSTSQLKSFDTSTVARWVNSRFSPPIHLTCHSVEHEGCQLVVITVVEFHDIPVMCMKQFDDPSNP